MRLPLSRDQQLGLVTLLTGVLATILVGCAVFSALPANGVEFRFIKQLQMTAWMPQGWAFFTAPPQSERRLPWVRVDGRWVSANAGPSATLRNAFGLRRGARLQNLEIEALVAKLPKSRWTSCRGSVASCVDPITPSIHVRNDSRQPTLCGDVAVTVSKPVPWAWAREGLHVDMPQTAIRMIVECSRS
jgi:antimicrobial peptide system SdpA family protein